MFKHTGEHDSGQTGEAAVKGSIIYFQGLKDKFYHGKIYYSPQGIFQMVQMFLFFFLVASMYLPNC